MLETLLAFIRGKGFMVASHNDYPTKDGLRVYWMFTHPEGRWVDGDGKTDKEALEQIAMEVS